MEVWLTSEDTGAYGRDLGSSLPELMRMVIEVLPEHVMLRLGMTNPPYILEHLEAMADIFNHPRVFAFVHIPVQSGSNPVLDRMNREYTKEDFHEVCDALLANVPKISLATDIICGFPTETEPDFDETLALVDVYKFPILNISQFYP
jgi:threonylcarbamoyladenosine tRNA methylthiotransferase CDKAL1